MSEATRVAIVGLGVIGGSAALKVKERGADPITYAAGDADRDLAARAGLRVASTLREAVADVDLVLIAVPLDRLADVAREVVSATPAHATILHTASLQRPDAVQLEPSIAERTIGTHPLAGSVLAGFAGASASLFAGATVYVEPRGTGRMREDAELFWSMAGARRIEYLPAAEHDDLMAAISHVPQIVSTALAATFAYANITRSRLGPGGRDTTRLGASSWAMWRPLLGATPGRTLAMLESVETEIRDMREAIAKATLDETGITWEVARNWALEVNPVDETSL